MFQTSVKWLVLGAIIVAILGIGTTESQACWWGTPGVGIRLEWLLLRTLL